MGNHGSRPRFWAEPHKRLRYFCSPQHTDTALYPIIGQMQRAAGLAHDDKPKARLDKLPDQSTRFGFPAAEAFEPDRWLHDGDTVRFGDEVLEVYHCPGHTPGHVVFFSRAHRLALVGDVLFAGSIGRTDFPRGNHADLVRSIREKLWPLGDDVTFVPGHGPTSTFGAERRTNPYVADGVEA